MLGDDSGCGSWEMYEFTVERWSEVVLWFGVSGWKYRVVHETAKMVWCGSGYH